MGMSGDFPVAIEEGATMVRVGTALFGERRGKTWKPGGDAAAFED
jgi:PLP dependent protein